MVSSMIDKKGQLKLDKVPCFSLYDMQNLVPLPGIFYSVKLTKQNGTKLLQGLKAEPGFENHDLLKNINIDDITRTRELDDSVMMSMRVFQDNSYMVKDKKSPSIYICLIPAADHSIGCISVISEVQFEGLSCTITFRLLARAVIDQPVLNMKNELWYSPVTVLDDLKLISSWNQKQLDISKYGVFDSFNKLDASIEDFKERYKTSIKQPITESGRALLISPLANFLYVYLKKSQFSRLWETLKIMCAGISAKKPGKQTVLDFMALMDLVIAVLPTTVPQKLQFLGATDPSLRITKFVEELVNFNEIFVALHRSSEYLGRHYACATDLEKAKFLANHFKSLNLYIDDMKNNNSDRAMMRGSKSPEKSSRQGVLGTPPDKSAQGSFGNGDGDGDDLVELGKFINSLESKNVHPDGIKILKKAFKRISKMQTQYSEYQVLRNYFDIIMEIPFGIYTENKSIDLATAKEKLDSDHYGLVQVKRRLLEYLSVLKLREMLHQTGLKEKANTDTISATTPVVNASINKSYRKTPKPPFLLLVGPPGVGKSSIANSVANVLGRKFQRISLGGVHNEADIRGHRRTYVGSMTGQIINALCKAGCMNPVILLDEIDKVLDMNSGTGRHGSRINGDPGAALLEVLDPEQNDSFMDHYVGFPVDLSRVLFLCTANDLSGLSAPLRDRMELITIEGYTSQEKIAIGRDFLLPKQISLNSLDLIGTHLELAHDAWESIVTEYTREPGIRNLNRRIAAVVRGKVIEHVENNMQSESHHTISKDQLPKYLGLPLHPIVHELTYQTSFALKYGSVNGLSYNSDGSGSVLVFEVIRNGTTKEAGPIVHTTGNLGSILEESIRISTSLVKSLLIRQIVHDENPNSTKPIKEFLSTECHLHVPMGAISKDGPSAGAAISLALLSLAFKRPVDTRLCITGEITLRGKILPVGGIKEKLLGAQLYGMSHALIPKGNRNDVIQTVYPYTDQQQAALDDLSMPELKEIRSKIGIKVSYCNDLHDLVSNVWPHNSSVLWSDQLNPTPRPYAL
ncbi:uncharacterized protein Ecym_2174 [Eremothecium cymbalariae DBVPG|uniref:Lon protease homolog 2, peroxisomal n=1 Tax=Eremothecium cymbalariae (strain CBS 270.75 / DBVPG 7215 / KCTC 17166 / NRRL Y-17582) TaxID=931890 RepID=G8JNK9_ERECY|nr:Hypothetical protein Ecym_2174 [Eremothecium cymbalariae DBVPG\